MKPAAFRSYFVGALMLIAAGLAVALTPKDEWSDTTPFNMEASLPQQFGAWKAVPSSNALAALTPNRDDARVYYDQTLMRTYQGPDGALVMLAVAWGRRQSQEVKVHRPELCYTAQGFQIVAKQSAAIQAGQQTIPVTRLVARSPQRLEPITYWIRLGNHFSSGPVETRLTIFKQAVLGNVPDGVLVRVSSIAHGNEDVDSEFKMQQSFLKDLLENSNATGKRIMVGQRAAQGAS